MSQNYDALVARLAEYARLHPRMYRARVAGLAVLGYAYLFAALVLLAAFVAALIWIILQNFGAYVLVKAVLPFVVLAWMIGKALWVRFTPPEGLELRPGEAPELMAEIERIRTAMKAPRVHTVLITDDFNAGVNQYARLGILGGYRTYLLLGLPYMAGMPLDEYRAVLAHEFGHVSRAHGRFGAWIARVHGTWLRLMEELDRKNHWAQSLFSRFFHGYAPYFEAYTAVLRRANEFEADRMAEAVSPGASASSLCRGQVTGRYLQRDFWPGVFARTLHQVEPPRGVFPELLQAVRTAHEHPRAAEWLDEALAETTFVWDTHPALRERLAALGLEPALPRPYAQSAAEALLGGRVRPLADRLTHQWRKAVGPYWREQHRQAVEISAKLARLEQKADLTPAEHGERVWLTAQLHGDPVAVPMARALLGTGHEDASIHYLLGRALAEEKDEAALHHLERAMAMDDEFTPPACAVAAGLLDLLGRGDEAEAYRRRIADYQRVLAAAEEERSTRALRTRDHFLPHGLTPEQLAHVREQVAVPGVSRAFVVRKRVEHFPENPLFVIGLALPFGRLRLPGESRRIMNQVAEGLALPGSWMVLVLEGGNTHFGPPLLKVHGSEVYRAPSFWRRGDRTGATA